MTLFEMMHIHFTTAIYVELIIRIVLAAVCGGLVGIERTRRFKDAGVRTHCLVACTAAILMIISKYGFADLSGAAGAAFAVKDTDPARIAAQIVSGISFLGVGIIYRDKHYFTKGLTTAAGIWGVAGIGMCLGAGMYVVGVFATLFMLFLQWLTHRFVIGNDKYKSAEMVLVMDDDSALLERLHKKFETWGVVIVESAISREGGSITYELEVKLPDDNTMQQEMAAYLASEQAVRSIELSNQR